MKDGDLLSLGFVVSVHGLKGVVKVKTYSGRADNLSAESFLYITKSSGEIVKLKVKKIQKQKNLFLVSFYGIETVEQALELEKAQIYKKYSELLPTEEDEYYFAELIGLEVFSVEGKFLGKVCSIIETGANIVILVKKDGKELLFPFIKSVVKAVDKKSGKMILDATGYQNED